MPRRGVAQGEDLQIREAANTVVFAERIVGQQHILRQKLGGGTVDTKEKQNPFERK